jgi:predicted outer membrane repeat protein
MKLVHSLLAAAIAAASPVAGAATFTVTNLNDSGTGSLRDAVALANAAAGADSINFQTGLTGTIALTGGEIRISDALTINGPGANRIAVDGNDASRIFKVQRAGGLAITATISGLTLTHGRADEGGAIYSNGDHVVVNYSVLTDNLAVNRGGALWVAEANLTVLASQVLGNATGSSGGGILFSAGDLLIQRSLVADNASQFGGGLSALSPRVKVTIADSNFIDNSADHTGGGMYATTITAMNISGSAFVGNETGQPNGGGIYFAGVTDFGSAVNVIENSTFSDNRSLHQTGRGAALAVASGNMTLRNDTFAYNKTSPNDAPGAGAGGAVWVANGATTQVNLQSTLFAGNTHGNQGALSDLLRQDGGSTSTINAVSTSFQTAPDATTINGTSQGNLMSVDPLLEPLAIDRGGSTFVHPLPENSPVLDHGSNPGNLTWDQRGQGYPRAASASGNGPGVTDIGAFEFRVDRIFFGDFEQH